jgi:hypothetical protein
VKEKKGFLSFLNIESIIDNLTGLVEKKVELFVIEIKEDAAKAGARIVVIGILSLSLFMAVLFISIGISFVIGKLLDNEMLGFFMMGLFYLVLLLLFFFLKDFLNLNKKLEKFILEILNKDKKNGGKE